MQTYGSVSLVTVLGRFDSDYKILKPLTCNYFSIVNKVSLLLLLLLLYPGSKTMPTGLEMLACVRT